ncbi:hypothetical protein SDC9_161347 [bioreactor metagenome]|uniref:Uncharacterized protein n=1 Tax=bioreactor metagenome TaxID=1076179 RepID=A0A645FI04_9ZZZZ
MGGGLHECTAPGLYIKHNAIAAGGKLFAHDARRNKRYTADCRGYIAQSIQLFIGRDQIAALSNNSGMNLIDLGYKFCFIIFHLKMGN